jgi:periplasmic protein TonB
MRKILFLVTVIITQFASSQISSDSLYSKKNDGALYSLKGIEVKPEYPGGIEQFYEFISKNYKAPKVEGLRGKVYVSFVIEKDGSLTDIKLLKDVGFGSGEEAIRVLKKCKNWIPGEQNGKKVRVQFVVPISIETK